MIGNRASPQRTPHTNNGNLDPGETSNGVGWSGTIPAGEWIEVDLDLFGSTPSIGAGDVIEIRFAAHVAFGSAVAGWLIDDLSVSD